MTVKAVLEQIIIELHRSTPIMHVPVAIFISIMANLNVRAVITPAIPVKDPANGIA